MRHPRLDKGLLSHFFYFIALLFIALFLLWQFDQPADKKLSITGELGELRLAFWFPETSAPVPLEGDWLGFPDQLLSPDEVTQNLQNSVPVRFPDVWQPPGPRRHVMTYTLLLKRIPHSQALALKIPEIKNSFRLFLNQREIAAGGFTSDDGRLSSGYFGDRIIPLGKLPDQARLTLQVSNFDHSRGGVHAPPVLASAEHWSDYYHYNILVECVVVSLALIAGFLILLEFYLVPEHKELLWFSLFSLVLAGYVGTSGLGSLATLIPAFPWPLAVRLEYIGFVAAIPLFLNWLAALYQDDVPLRLIRWVFRAAMALVFYVVLTPSSLFTELLLPLLFFMCCTILLSGWIILRLFIRNRSGVKILVFGALALLAGILHDLMLYLELLQGRNMLSVGVLVFLVAQIGFLTFYRTQEQIRILDLNRNLKATRQTLENNILQRQQEITEREQTLYLCQQEYQRLLHQDALTGLMNRHHFLELVVHRMERMRRFGYAVVIVDIDQYKQIVDRQGRTFAETALKRVAEVLHHLCEGYFDRIPARYGGDEFIIWLGRGDQKEAEALARDIRLAVSRIVLYGAESPDDSFRFTVSTGVACSDALSPDLNTLLARASDAVHQSRYVSAAPSGRGRSTL